MAASFYRLRPARPDDLPAILEHLKSADLPTAGVTDHLEGFLVAEDGARLVATGALERYGPAALLRSVAVDPALRKRGLGRAVVARLLDHAAEAGVKHVYLLTTAAADYFAAWGFRPVDRGAIPEAVHASAELRGACPDSAVAMALDLS